MKTLLRIIGRGVLLLVAAVVSAYVLKGVVGSVELVRTKKQVRDDIEHGLSAGVNDATNGQERLRDHLSTYGAPAHSWQELRCDFSSRDAGLFPQLYLQDCEVRVVDLYAVEQPSPGSRCTSRSSAVSPGQPTFASRVSIGSTDALTAKNPYWSCPRHLVSAPDRFHATRLLSGSRPEDLSTSPAWVVAETTTDVSSTEIGCNPWGVIFCGQPYAEPVLP
jgi:hypothetical protein